jgi:hypothetical protein
MLQMLPGMALPALAAEQLWMLPAMPLLSNKSSITPVAAALLQTKAQQM